MAQGGHASRAASEPLGHLRVSSVSLRPHRSCVRTAILVWLCHTSINAPRTIAVCLALRL